MLGTDVDFIDTLKFVKSRRSISSTVSTAAVTSASTGLSYSSWRRCLGSEPELTPTRSGMPSSVARLVTSATFSGPPMLPGFSRTQCGAGVERLQRQRVVEVDVGDHRDRRLAHDRAQRLGILLARHGDAHDVGAGLGDAVDLGHRGGQVGRLGLGHRLHGDGRSAADRHVSDVDLALRGHGPECRAGSGLRPAAGGGGAWPARRIAVVRPSAGAAAAPAHRQRAERHRGQDEHDEDHDHRRGQERAARAAAAGPIGLPDLTLMIAAWITSWQLPYSL